MCLHTGSLLVAAGRSTTSLCSRVCWFYGPNEGAQEFAIYLRCNRVDIDASRGEKFTRIFCPINSRWLDVDLLKTRCGEFAAIFVISERPCHTPDPQKHALADFWRNCTSRHNIGNRHAATRLQHTECLSQYAVFVCREVDHTIRDDHVDRVVRQRDMLDLALQELDILRARFALVLIGKRQHLVRHITTVGLAAGSNPPRRKQHIYAASRT